MGVGRTVIDGELAHHKRVRVRDTVDARRGVLDLDILYLHQGREEQRQQMEK